MELADSPNAAPKTTRQNPDRLLWILAAPALVFGSLAFAKLAQSNSIDTRLFRAAAAAAQEATMPRASRTSIVLAAQRMLARDDCAAISPDLELQINSRAAESRWIDCRSGDVVSVTLTTDQRFLGPDLFGLLGLRLSPAPLRITAIRQKP